ncbi:MAG TPA: UDP-3-O-(3-hydroxymyristoyl)glucosamine N-acyltransferase [Acidobacteriaceae bacterium]|jgi:UDP-3-O-[3-hydroxymyristoyl] glucosamine N-acyltransferase|nr:UDP-3-O-(3-hydroxymyristoyl)glucosamine N-acyltransferase [Acidobacteriaceae bacterium]
MATLGNIADHVGGTVAKEARGVEISRVASPANAGSEALIFAEDAAAVEAAMKSNAGAVIVPIGASQPGKPVIEAKQPRLAFALARRMLDMRPHAEMTTMERGDENAFAIADTAIVSNYAVLGEGVSIGEHSVVAAGCVVGAHVVIGAECLIHPHVTIYPGVVIGNRVVVHAGAVLGADGFGYVRDERTGGYVQFPQQGALVIENDVEIGANTTIDRGALDETRIGRGTKLDNLVHVGHNVRIGKNVVIAAQTGISGSSSIGDGAVIAGQVGIGDHAEVGEGVILGGRAGVLNNKKLHGAGKLFWGTPARPVREYLKDLAALARLGKK